MGATISFVTARSPCRGASKIFPVNDATIRGTRLSSHPFSRTRIIRVPHVGATFGVSSAVGKHEVLH